MVDLVRNRNVNGLRFLGAAPRMLGAQLVHLGHGWFVTKLAAQGVIGATVGGQRASLGAYPVQVVTL